MTYARTCTWDEAFLPGTKRYLRDTRRDVAAGKPLEVAQVALRVQWSVRDDLVIIPELARMIVWDLFRAAIETGGQVRLKPYRDRLAAIVSPVNPLLTKSLDPREFAMVLPEDYEAFARHARVRFGVEIV